MKVHAIRIIDAGGGDFLCADAVERKLGSEPKRIRIGATGKEQRGSLDPDLNFLSLGS